MACEYERGLMLRILRWIDVALLLDYAFVYLGGPSHVIASQLPLARATQLSTRLQECLPATTMLLLAGIKVIRPDQRH